MSQTYEFHFRRRYHLPPTDPRFLGATFEECVVDWWAHRHWEDPKLREQGTTQEFNSLLDEVERQMTEEMARRLEHKLGREVEATPEALLAVVQGKDTPGATQRVVPAPAEEWEEVSTWKGR